MSGTGYIGKHTNRNGEVVGAQTQEERESQWGPIPGEVVAGSYDAATQTATIKPLYRPRHAGKAVDMPELLKVPIRFPRTGSTAITHPIPDGTRVMLIPQMRSMENYHTDGDGEASDTRSFALSDMEAHLTGGDSLNNPLPNVDPANLHIRADPEGLFGIRLSPEGKVSIEGSDGNVYELVADAADLAATGFEKLGMEALVFAPDYATIGVALRDIATKLAAMKLT